MKNTQPEKWRKTKTKTGFLVHETLDVNNTLRGIRKYFYKNKQAYRITLDSKLAKQLAGYALIEKDLRSTLVWLQAIDGIQADIQINGSLIAHDREKYNLVKGLYVASLVFYGKCFSQCEGRNARLNQKNIDKKFVELHNEIIKQRNNFGAHSGAEKIELATVALVFPQQKNAYHIFDIFTELDQPDVLNKFGDLKFIDLVMDVHNKACQKRSELTQLIIEKDLKEKEINEWIALGKKSIR